MKSIAAQCIHVVLALFILAAAVTPACAGGDNCSMPCCRHKTKPDSHQTDAARSKPCCTQTADASAGTGSGCRFDQHSPALRSGGETGPITAAALAAMVLESPKLSCTATPAARCMDSSPPDTPLYLRLHALLI
jgi:hypothetical protein